MNTDPEGVPELGEVSERGEAAEHLERAERRLKTEADEGLREVDEAIRKAEKKSKAVIPDVPSPTDDS
jgi:hypothetical protein